MSSTTIGRGQNHHPRREHVAAAAAYQTRVLAAELRAVMNGDVHFDDGSRALYATDASNYRQVPIGVVAPRTVEDVISAVARCHQRGIPILARGGGTSLAGQCCNTAVVLDMSRYMNAIVRLDPAAKRARVQPGIILDSLREAAERHHLTFGPDPATHNRCTIGGMIGNDSCGAHSVMAGKTVDNVEELDVLTYDGVRMRVGRTSAEDFARIQAEGGRRAEIYAGMRALVERYAAHIRTRYPKIPRRVSGYNLPDLLPESGFNVARALVGTEGTCVTVLEATLRLVASPRTRILLVLGYPDVYQACDNVMAVLEHGPVALEGFDDHLVQSMRAKHLRTQAIDMLPDGGGWLLVEFGGETTAEASDKARGLMRALGREPHAPQMRLLERAEEVRQMWELRESGLGGTARVPNAPPNWPGWEDSAVPPERMGDYLRALRKLLDAFNYFGAFYGHFGQGCLHSRTNFDLTTAEGIARFRAFMDRAADLCLSFGGSLSGEHGDGQARAELLPKMFGAELMQAFREFKSLWDPEWKMNPGKMVDPYRMDDNLRLGTDYQPAQPRTHFQYQEDGGSLAHATLRCVGVGKCRRLGGETMCPSFMVTREEKDSTRGRARLLFEMLRGDILRDGWRDDAVRESLDLCLACKGCKSDCPVNVDMATYKAEFLSHYYAGRLRPIAAYSMGWIYWWARLAALAPRLVNVVTHAPLLATLAKAAAGVAPQRTMPAFAPQTFTQWLRARGERNAGRPDVLLWPDTFNNHFHPQTAIAAVEVLEAAGYHVVVPRQSLCCGRPLYDFGMLDMAERLLRQILEALRPQIRAGIPIVVLEPSCASVFRDELTNLFPNDEDARRLRQQTVLLSEFLIAHAPGYEPPRLARRAVVHGHCHHKSVLGMGAEETLLRKMGLEYTLLDDGCCGMAGAFGFERDHYGISIACGERVLLPAVRAAADDTIIVSDGFSCREQIEQTTDRRSLHIAQVLQMALRDGPDGPRAGRPEDACMRSRAPTMRRRTLAWVVAAGAVALGAIAGVRATTRRH